MSRLPDDYQDDQNFLALLGLFRTVFGHKGTLKELSTSTEHGPLLKTSQTSSQRKIEVVFSVSTQMRV